VIRRPTLSRHTTGRSSDEPPVRHGPRRPRPDHHLYPTGSPGHVDGSAHPPQHATRMVGPQCDAPSDQVGQQQVRQPQPRLVDDVVALGGRPIRSGIVPLTEVPTERPPRNCTKQRCRRYILRRLGALFPHRWPIKKTADSTSTTTESDMLAPAVKPPPDQRGTQQDACCRNSQMGLGPPDTRVASPIVALAKRWWPPVVDLIVSCTSIHDGGSWGWCAFC
jgi:hypothetical protein